VNELRRNDRTTERIMTAQRVMAAENSLATDPASVCCERQGTSACCQDSGGRRSQGTPTSIVINAVSLFVWGHQLL
jgi:hypothetical protein